MAVPWAPGDSGVRPVIEQVLVTHIINTGDVVSVLSGNIREDFFHTERGRKAWVWIYEYWSKHSECPGRAAFLRQFPTYEFSDSTDEPIDALIDELRRAHIFEITKDGLAEVVERFDNPDENPTPAIESMQRLLATISVDNAAADVEQSSDFLIPFVEQLLEQDPMMLQGIPSGFPSIDTQLAGFHDEQLITIIGLPKTGKSTFALACAMSAERHGKRVVVISFEMSNLEQKQRYVSLGAGVSLTSIQRGLLTASDEEKLLNFQIDKSKSKDNGDRGELILVHDIASIMTVGGVAAKIKQLQPDMVIVDGVYMMTDEQGEKSGSSQALTNVTRSFKRLCQSAKVPLVCTTQALFSKVNTKRGTQLDSIGYTSSFAQDSDVILAVDKPDIRRPDTIFRIAAARNSIGLDIGVIVDLSRGLIKETGIIVDVGYNTGYDEDYET